MFTYIFYTFLQYDSYSKCSYSTFVNVCLFIKSHELCFYFFNCLCNEQDYCGPLSVEVNLLHGLFGNGCLFFTGGILLGKLCNIFVKIIE